MAIVYLPVEQSDADQIASDIKAVGRTALLLPGDVIDWRGPQRGYAARPAYAGVGPGPPPPQPGARGTLLVRAPARH